MTDIQEMNNNELTNMVEEIINRNKERWNRHKKGIKSEPHSTGPIKSKSKINKNATRIYR